ncbi:MAG: homocysteine S-methyltransferase family protein [Oscillospiraceae bacterium]|nr:homocysteine S-methyltransferase family protein [Oscillospiraceae bacterium]
MNIFSKLPFILDGATGTRLQSMGMPSGAYSVKWVLDNPDAIIKIQKSYAHAGSDAVIAPTFGADRITASKYGATESVADICGRLVDLSRKAVGDLPVAGDIAPTGLILEPLGETTYDELFEVFAELAAALDKAGVDMFAVETQMCLGEASAAVEAVRSVSDKPTAVSFSCGPTGRSLWGEDLSQVMEELTGLGIEAFGINCCGDLDLIADVLKELKKTAKVPLIAKPNAGIPKSSDGKFIYDMTPQMLAGYVPKLTESGALILGGCCGTDENHIRAIKDALSLLPANAGI